MYFKLAIKNVKKSYKEYFIYFATLLSAICLFYTFNSFGDQAVVLELNEIQNNTVQALKQIMSILSIVIGVVCGFLILYANNFLIKRRKKEIGIYMLLGMENKTISKILIYETIIVGITSLISGLIAGFILSQGITSLTSHLLSASRKFQFVFSIDALIWTLGCFILIFGLVALFNLFLINKYSLIQLLKASRINQIIKLKNSKLSIVLFIISICMLAFIYYLGLAYSVKYLKTIVIIGTLGTILFFYASAGFFLSFISSKKKIYFRDLTMFITRQLNAKINETYIMIAVVCLMLLISIGALLTGFNLNNFVREEVKKVELFDFSMGGPTSKKENIKLDQILRIDRKLIDDEFYVTFYDTTLSFSDFEKSYTGDASENPLFNNPNTRQEHFFPIIPVSEINKLLVYQNKDELNLRENEAVMFNSNPAFESTFKKINNLFLAPYGTDLKVIDILDMTFVLYVEPYFGSFLVINDNEIPENETGTRLWSVKLTNSEMIDEVKANLEHEVKNYNQQNPNSQLLKQSVNGEAQDAIVLESHKLAEGMSGLTIIITYISLYLGLIFLICSVVILALQQLSEITDNKKRYTSLMLMGVDEKMINRALFVQLSIYFGLPLFLAGVHAYFGIKVVLDVLKSIGE